MKPVQARVVGVRRFTIHRDSEREKHQERKLMFIVAGCVAIVVAGLIGFLMTRKMAASTSPVAAVPASEVTSPHHAEEAANPLQAEVNRLSKDRDYWFDQYMKREDRYSEGFDAGHAAGVTLGEAREQRKQSEKELQALRHKHAEDLFD